MSRAGKHIACCFLSLAVAAACKAERPDSDPPPSKPVRKPAAIAEAPPKREAPRPATLIPEEMIGVPGGRFEMGLSDRGIPDEQPAHPVAVAPFLLDRTEVTNGAYADCVAAGKCRRPAHLDTVKSGFAPLEAFRLPAHPVSGVSHEDAEKYCAFVGKRLPREAEWERAARGSDGRLFPWGDDLPDETRAVFRSKVTKPVGSLPEGKGPYGHLDLGGNVWEWVHDNYDPYAYTRETAGQGIPGDCEQILAALRELKRKGKQGFTGTNPIPDECEHVLRGGAFNYFPWGLRSSNRVHHPGRFRMIMAGFRCARDWPDGPTE